MESIKANLVFDDATIVADVTVRFAVGPGGKWAGSFVVPPSPDRLHLGEYQLLAGDGRCGTIKIDRLSVSPDGTEFWFKGQTDFA